MPVFPLPGFVLFPRAVVPLHVFELRYRALVRDALRSDRLIATALLKPGWESDYHGSPEFFPLGCLARVDEVQWRTDDCYDLKVLGLSRVRLQRTAGEYPYRSATVTLVPQEPLAEGDPLVDLERRALMDACARAAGRRPHGDPSSFEALVNGVCLEWVADAAERLELLELDSLLERSRRVRERIERNLRRPAAPDEGGERN